MTTATLEHVKTPRMVESITTCPGLPLVIARCDDALLAVDESRLGADAPPLDLSRPDVDDVLATDVEAWSLEPISRSLTLVRAGGVELANLAPRSEPRRLPLADLRGDLVAAHVAPDQKTLLCVTCDEERSELGHYRVDCVDLASRRAAITWETSASVPPKCAWSAAASAFLVFEPQGETLWRLRPAARAPDPVPLPDLGGRSAVEMHLNPPGNWLVIVLEDQRELGSHLLSGLVTADAVKWEGTTSLAEGLLRLVRWHPTERQVAYERTTGRRSMLETVNPRGGAPKSCPLPAEWFSNDLAWSSDGKRVYATGRESVGLWKV
jgi:hypothetical protein